MPYIKLCCLSLSAPHVPLFSLYVVLCKVPAASDCRSGMSYTDIDEVCHTQVSMRYAVYRIYVSCLLRSSTRYGLPFIQMTPFSLMRTPYTDVPCLVAFHPPPFHTQVSMRYAVYKIYVPCPLRSSTRYGTPHIQMTPVSLMRTTYTDVPVSLLSALSSKVRLIHSLVTFIFLYACESWTLTAELQRRIQAMEMRCYRKILCISYKDHVTNEEVRAKIQQAIGPHEDLLTIVKRRKLEWYGHVSRSSGLAKNRLARHSERGKKTRRTKEEVGRQHQGMYRPGVRQVPEGSGEQ